MGKEDKYCTMYCGKHEYDVSIEAKHALEGTIYWEYEYECCVADLEYARQKGDCTPEEINNLEYEIERALKTVHFNMEKMDKCDIPNWLGNAALQWGRDFDRNNRDLYAFFHTSQYSEMAHNERLNQESQKEDPTNKTNKHKSDIER